MIRIYAIAAAGFLLTLLAGIWIWTLYARPDNVFATCTAGQVAGDIGGPFELVDASGTTVTDQQVITEPTLIYFGYTFCPDVCPLDMSRTADAVDLLEERGMSVTPVFITVDPKRDTPEVVGDFAGNLHDKMIGLTGSPEQVKAASTAYKTYYKSHEGAGDDPYYLVDHSTFTYLMLPEHGFVDFFRHETSAEEMAERVACFVDKV